MWAQRVEEEWKKPDVDDAIPETGETEVISVDERVTDDETAPQSGARDTNAPFKCCNFELERVVDTRLFDRFILKTSEITNKTQ